MFRGKWQYEVMLASKGVMQVGWATQRCRFSQEKGVGDTEDSYAYDGNRVRKWNLNTYVYGESWQSGDVIGCTLDLEDGSIDFYRNGRHLGLAFNRVRVGPGMVYFPAVSLAYNETLVANFGATPIKYPVPGYQPLEEIPFGEVAKGDVLLSWLFNLIRHETSKADATTIPSASNHSSSTLSHYLITNILLQRLAPLLRNKYIVEACLLRKLLTVRDNQEIHGMLDVFWALLEKQQLHECLENLAFVLINGYRYSNVILGANGVHEAASPSPFSTSSTFYMSSTSSATPYANSINFASQKKYLLVFLTLTQHPATRSYLLKHVLFDKVKFALLLDVKPVTDSDILERDIFPGVSAQGVLSPGASKLLKSSSVESATAEVESLHQMILDTLIFQDEVCRVMFIAKFDAFLRENSNFNPIRLAANASSPQMASPLPVILCFFHRLASLIRIQYENMINVLPISFFVESTCVSSDVTRVGGLVTHLTKSYERDLTKYIETASSMNPLLKHVYILIDGLIRLYSIGAHKMLGKHCVVRESLGELSTALTELQGRATDGSAGDEAYQMSSRVLEQELLVKSRQLGWINSTVLTSSKR